MLVRVHGGPRQRRHRFALRARNHYQNLLRRIIADLARVDEKALGRIDIFKIHRDFRGIRHAAAHQRNLSVVGGSQFQCELDAMDARRKTRDEQATVGAPENIFKAWTHRAFAGRVARTLDVGRILEQRQHAFFAIFGKCVQIE